MSQPAAKGSPLTKREHLEQVTKQFQGHRPGWVHPDLELPELSPRLAYLWEWFREVQTGERLTWLEIRSWSEMTGKELTSFEAKVIRRLSFIQFNILNTPPK